jgi:hypothetical protein
MSLSKKIISSTKKRDYGDILSTGTASKNNKPDETSSSNPYKKETSKTPPKVKKLSYKRKEIIS